MSREELEEKVYMFWMLNHLASQDIIGMLTTEALDTLIKIGEKK